MPFFNPYKSTAGELSVLLPLLLFEAFILAISFCAAIWSAAVLAATAVLERPVKSV
jgi:hypothetical protein